MSTFDKVREVIVDQLGVNPEDVTENSNIQTDFGADSITLMEIIVELEDMFDIEVPEEKLLEIKTIGDIVKELDALQ